MRRIVRKLKRDLPYWFYRFLGRDSLTKLKINKRNDLQELGNPSASWFVPASLLNSDSICYCVGCGEDISFDLALKANFDCDIYAFDPTPKAIEYVAGVAGDDNRYHLHKVGIWNENTTLKFFLPQKDEHVSCSIVNLQKTDKYLEVPVKTLKTLTEELGHTQIDLLKIDIEGAEYEVINSFLDDGIDVKILCVEYDEINHPLDAAFRERILTSVTRLLQAGYAMSFVEGNGNYLFIKEP